MPHASPPPVATPTHAASPRPARLLWALGVAHAVGGLIEPFVPAHLATLQAATLGAVVGVLCYVWARADALARHAVAAGRSPLWAALLPLVGVPLYLFRTRPARLALRHTALAVAYGASVTALGWACAGVASAARAAVAS